MIAIKRSGFFPSQVNIRINILIPLFLSQLFPNVHKASSNISLELSGSSNTLEHAHVKQFFHEYEYLYEVYTINKVLNFSFGKRGYSVWEHK